MLRRQISNEEICSKGKKHTANSQEDSVFSGFVLVWTDTLRGVKNLEPEEGRRQVK